MPPDVATLVESPQRRWMRLHPGYQRQYYLANHERVLNRMKLRRKTEPEKTRAVSKKSRQKHLESARQSTKNWQKAHPDKGRAACRRWYHRNLEIQRARGRAKNGKYQAKLDPAAVRKYKREWCRKNHHRMAHYEGVRRALKKGAAVNLAQMKEWIASVKSKPTAKCYYCGNTISSKTIHLDHIIALSKGGAHSVENLCVSCAHCNCSKRDKRIDAWVRIGQQVLSL